MKSTEFYWTTILKFKLGSLMSERMVLVQIIVWHLTHWGLGMILYALVNLVIIDTDNGLWLLWCQTMSWTNYGLLYIGPLRTSFSNIWIKIQTFFKQMFWQMLSVKWWFCLNLNVSNGHHHLNELTLCPMNDMCDPGWRWVNRVLYICMRWHKQFNPTTYNHKYVLLPRLVFLDQLCPIYYLSRHLSQVCATY